MLEKYIWTDQDYPQMGWHDCRIYKLRLTQDLELDIDYISQWNPPDLEGLSFTFWVAPATLVFKNVRIISLELDTVFHEAVEIEDIEKVETANGSEWIIMTHQGDIELVSDGYEQFIRQEPTFQFGQTLSFLERDGLSLDRMTGQSISPQNQEAILEQRKKDFEHYENVKKRHLKRKEREQLENDRNNNTIDLKEYLLKKKEMKEWLNYYDYFLKGTRFENW